MLNSRFSISLSPFLFLPRTLGLKTDICSYRGATMASAAKVVVPTSNLTSAGLGSLRSLSHFNSLKRGQGRMAKSRSFANLSGKEKKLQKSSLPRSFFVHYGSWVFEGCYSVLFLYLSKGLSTRECRF